MIGVIIVTWLALCAWQDWKRREVSNWLTLPPMVLAFILRLLGRAAGPLPLLGLILIIVLMIFQWRWFGGADAKVLIALALLDTRLALWAWTGTVAWYGLLFLYGRSIARDRDRIRLPGMLGFLIGAGWFWLWR